MLTIWQESCLIVLHSPSDLPLKQLHVFLRQVRDLVLAFSVVADLLSCFLAFSVVTDQLSCWRNLKSENNVYLAKDQTDTTKKLLTFSQVDQIIAKYDCWHVIKSKMNSYPPFLQTVSLYGMYLLFILWNNSSKRKAGRFN